MKWSERGYLIILILTRCDGNYHTYDRIVSMIDSLSTTVQVHVTAYLDSNEEYPTIPCGYAPELFTRRINEPFGQLLRTPPRPHQVSYLSFVGRRNHHPQKAAHTALKYVIQVPWH
jgi:hypothetical protein